MVEIVAVKDCHYWQKGYGLIPVAQGTRFVVDEDISTATATYLTNTGLAATIPDGGQHIYMVPTAFFHLMQCAELVRKARMR